MVLARVCCAFSAPHPQVFCFAGVFVVCVHGIGTCLLRFFCPLPSGVLIRWCFCCLRTWYWHVFVALFLPLTLKCSVSLVFLLFAYMVLARVCCAFSAPHPQVF